MKCLAPPQRRSITAEIGHFQIVLLYSRYERSAVFNAVSAVNCLSGFSCISLGWLCPGNGSSRRRCLVFANSPETFSANFETYDNISFVNLHHPSFHLASEDVTRDRMRRVARKHHIHLQEVERANGMVLGWGKCWTSDLSQPRFQHFVRHYFRLSADVFALQLSPVGVTSQDTTERTTDKQSTALTAINTALLSLREYNYKPIENDQILLWSTSVVELVVVFFF